MNKETKYAIMELYFILASTITLVLLGLKLAAVINCDWIWITVALWAPFLLVIVGGLGYILAQGLIILFEELFL